MQPGNVMVRQTFNQFIMSTMMVAALHLGYVWSQPEYIGPAALLPLAIDSAILLLAFGILLAARWVALKLPLGDRLVLSGLPSTLIFFLLGFSAFSMLVYSAYTGDRLNISLVAYFIDHPSELFAPIAAETGYLPLFMVAVLAILAGFALHRAHQLNARHLLLIFLLSTLGLLLTGAYAGQKNERMYAFFSPGGNPQILPSGEGYPASTPAWFKSFYLTLFGWDHAAYGQNENAAPNIQYIHQSLESQAGNRPNILILALESIRASATSPYNSSPGIRNLTPNLDHLAQSGLLVEHAYTTVPHTSKALVGIFCGQFPRRQMEIIEAAPGGLPVPCLPKLLAQAGYQTAFFQSAWGKFESRHGLTGNMGFQQTYTQEQLPHQAYKKLSFVGMDDYVMLDPAINWMKEKMKRGEPFLTGMLTVVSHHPYTTPESTRVLHSNDPAYLDEAYSSYLASVAYTDRFIGDLIRKMEQAGLMKNTIVIITGDHGEAFAEHGPVFHNSTPHEEGMKVPLVLYSPSLLPAPKHIAGLRSHLDILPTVLDMAGIKVSGELPGKSLFSPTGHETLSGACWYENHCAVQYKANGEKYIYWHGRKPNEYYQLRPDPGETTNLIRTLTSDKEGQLVLSTFARLNSYQTVYGDSPQNSSAPHLASK